MKKNLAVILAMLMVFGMLAGCGSTKSTPEPTPTPSSQLFEGKITAVSDTSVTVQGANITASFAISPQTQMSGKGDIAQGDDASVEYEGDITQNPNAIRISFKNDHPDDSGTVSGVVADASMHNLVVTVADGHTYSFSMDDDTVVNAPQGAGILLGDEVTVVYTGSLNQCPVAHSITINSSPTVAHDSRDVKGQIVALSDGELVLTVDSGHTYTFDLSANPILKGADQLRVDDVVTVTFTGDLSGVPMATVITVDEEAPAEPTHQAINGTCVAIHDRSFTITVDSSHSYTFTFNNDTQWGGSELELNCRPNLFYDGYLWDNPVATSVYINPPVGQKPAPHPVTVTDPPSLPAQNDPPAPVYTEPPAPVVTNPPSEPQSVETGISGVVTSLSGSGFTIQDSSGASHSFSVDGNTDYSGTLEMGARVKVSYMTITNLAVSITVMSPPVVIGVTGMGGMISG